MGSWFGGMRDADEKGGAMPSPLKLDDKRIHVGLLHYYLYFSIHFKFAIKVSFKTLSPEKVIIPL